ncbi:hypothetical protein M406DRAFT_74132 [Cryphonectria parasitica EP155]|uniref:Uncharacterized protein n=1 Tax=Cryphonectria parasitica (strain ATCC 38755 / EP155) TaxID=660469 RepID=A0A9P4XZB4_CRYP1|nr:uncharacterized protein M406DRAFT_74132 [Cryphonectria parasitica EP155]KAF3763540.1 hypothetical protein M406DRAFT_74132 [Cryphonectria parasitica EP155]
MCPPPPPPLSVCHFQPETQNSKLHSLMEFSEKTPLPLLPSTPSNTTRHKTYESWTVVSQHNRHLSTGLARLGRCLLGHNNRRRRTSSCYVATVYANRHFSSDELAAVYNQEWALHHHPTRGSPAAYRHELWWWWWCRRLLGRLPRDVQEAVGSLLDQRTRETTGLDTRCEWRLVVLKEVETRSYQLWCTEYRLIIEGCER